MRSTGAARVTLDRRHVTLSFALLAAALVALAVIAPVDHDESQYFAAAELAWRLRPFVDFLYLQPPLQPYLSAPVAAMSDAYSFLSLRIATGSAGIATLALVYLCQRALGVERATALGTTVLLALTASFQFANAVVRNDALPALLMACGMLCAIGALEGSPRRPAWLWSFVGVAFGAAAAAKISYALPATATGLFLLLRAARTNTTRGWVDAAACAAGAAAILAPTLLIRAAAPEAFDYGVFEYPATAPLLWYEQNGYGERLTLAAKFLDTAKYMLRGPAWLALGIVAFAAWTARSPRRPVRLLLDMLIVAGLIAALAPTPTWKQYLVPLLPPLFVRLGLASSEQSFAWPRWLTGALAAAALVGLAQPLRWGAQAARGGATVLTVTREAHWIGDRMRASGAVGEIATLSPQAVLDSGFALDRRFATGPFFYRTGDTVAPSAQRRMNVVSPRTLEAFLNERPPAAIVTGYESRDHVDRQNLDDGLRGFARTRGYRLARSPFGEAELYLRGR